MECLLPGDLGLRGEGKKRAVTGSLGQSGLRKKRNKQSELLTF